MIDDKENTVAEVKTEVRMCKAHGEFESNSYQVFDKTFWSNCCDCVKEADEKRKTEDDKKERLRKERVLRGMYDKSGIPARYMSASLQRYGPASEPAARVKAACVAYADDFKSVHEGGKNLLLTGSVGTGKTHLAIGIMHRVIRQFNMVPRYVTASGFIRGIKSTYGHDCDYTEQEYFNRYSACPLLVIDEIGVKFASDFERASLFELIDNRYNERLPTILISNLTISEITETMGERMMDRLSEGGSVLALNWKSHRASQ